MYGSVITIRLAPARYLTGLLGSDGTAATARTALGVINATAPTYAQVIAALGFTPPQPGGTGVTYRSSLG